jgi:hypothetical protein
MIDPLNPHVTLAQLKAFPRRSPPFTMPPPEGIIPGMCRAYERAIRKPHTWRSKAKPAATQLHFWPSLTHRVSVAQLPNGYLAEAA